MESEDEDSDFFDAQESISPTAAKAQPRSLKQPSETHLEQKKDTSVEGETQPPPATIESGGVTLDVDAEGPSQEQSTVRKVWLATTAEDGKTDGRVRQLSGEELQSIDEIAEKIEKCQGLSIAQASSLGPGISVNDDGTISIMLKNLDTNQMVSLAEVEEELKSHGIDPLSLHMLKRTKSTSGEYLLVSDLTGSTRQLGRAGAYGGGGGGGGDAGGDGEGAGDEGEEPEEGKKSKKTKSRLLKLITRSKSKGTNVSGEGSRENSSIGTDSPNTSTIDDAATNDGENNDQNSGVTSGARAGTGDSRLAAGRSSVSSSTGSSRGYIKVKLRNKRARHFSRLFLCQELTSVAALSTTDSKSNIIPPESAHGSSESIHLPPYSDQDPVHDSNTTDTATATAAASQNPSTAASGTKNQTDTHPHTTNDQAGPPTTAPSGAIWTMKFSKDGRYLATGGQDTIVRVWCLAQHASEAETASHQQQQQQQPKPASSSTQPSQPSVTTATVSASSSSSSLSADRKQTVPPSSSSIISPTGSSEDVSKSAGDQSHLPIPQHPHHHHRHASSSSASAAATSPVGNTPSFPSSPSSEAANDSNVQYSNTSRPSPHQQQQPQNQPQHQSHPHPHQDHRHTSQNTQQPSTPTSSSFMSSSRRPSLSIPSLPNTPVRENIFANAPLHEYKGHTADVLDLSWSKNSFLLSSSMDKTVRLWHTTRKECLCCFQHLDFVTAITFHPRDDRYFLSGSLDCKLRLWNIPEKKVACWNELPDNNLITAVGFTLDGKMAVAGSYVGLCLFFETEIHVKSSRRGAKGRKITGIEPMPGTPVGEEKLLITSNDSRIRLYNMKDKSLECKYKGLENTSSQIRASFADDGRYIICGSEDRCVYIWDTDNNRYSLRKGSVATSNDPNAATDDVGYDGGGGGGKRFLSGDHHGGRWLKGNRPPGMESFEAHTQIVTVAIFAPTRTKQLLASAGDTIFQLTASVSHPGQDPSTLSYPNGDILVTADYSGCIRVYRNDSSPPPSVDPGGISTMLSSGGTESDTSSIRSTASTLRNLILHPRHAGMRFLKTGSMYASAAAAAISPSQPSASSPTLTLTHPDERDDGDDEGEGEDHDGFGGGEIDGGDLAPGQKAHSCGSLDSSTSSYKRRGSSAAGETTGGAGSSATATAATTSVAPGRKTTKSSTLSKKNSAETTTSTVVTRSHSSGHGRSASDSRAGNSRKKLSPLSSPTTSTSTSVDRNRCPVCASTAIRSFAVLNDRGESKRMVVCSGCSRVVSGL